MASVNGSGMSEGAEALGWSEGYSIVYYILVAILLQLSLVVNSLVIAVVYSRPQLRTTPHILISSLAVSEMVFALFISARSIIASRGLLTGQWPEYNLLAHHVMIFIWLSTLCSNYTNILLISVERWLYIVWPFLHQKLDRPSVIALNLVIAWTIPLTANIEIVTDLSSLVPQLRLRFEYLFPALHFVWTTTLGVIYIHICVITRRQIKVIGKMSAQVTRLGKPQSKTFRTARENWKTFKMLVVVFGTFFVLNTPGVLYNIYLVATTSGNYFADVPWYIKFLTVLHNSSNYFVYVHQDRALYKLLRTKLHSFKCCFPQCRVHADPNWSNSHRLSSLSLSSPRTFTVS